MRIWMLGLEIPEADHLRSAETVTLRILLRPQPCSARLLLGTSLFLGLGPSLLHRRQLFANRILLFSPLSVHRDQRRHLFGFVHLSSYTVDIGSLLQAYDSPEGLSSQRS